MNETAPSVALALVIVDELARCGVQHACLAPGSRSAPLAMALSDDDRIDLHVVLDERSASFLALGIAKASGTPVAVLSTSGTAAANFHPAVVESHYARVPLLVVTADRPPELRDTGANQTIDQTNLYGTSVRWFAEVGTAGTISASVPYWRSVVARAFGRAWGPPAGPVHLNVALREPLVQDHHAPHIPSAELSGRPDGSPWHRIVAGRRTISQDAVEDIAGRLAAATRPLLVGGSGTFDSRTLLDFAGERGLPILAEPTSGLRSGPNAVSTYDALLRVGSWVEAHRPDVVLRVGKSGTSKALASYLDARVEQILVDDDPAFDDPERTATTVVGANPSELGAALLGSASEGSSEWLEEWRKAERVARAAIDSVLDEDDAPSEPRAARDVAVAMPEGSTLVVASSMPVRDLDWFMAPRSDLRVLANRGASGIDGFVSTALGCAVATLGPIAALAGDLSMLHDANGFTLANAADVDIVFVVLNNDGGGIFSFLPQAEWPESFESLFGTPHGLDFRKYADFFRCGYERLERAGDLDMTLKQAFAAGGPQLIEITTDRPANVELHRRVWKAVEQAINPREQTA
jgi:2-succinyl-5-enolpyruvyl-6-hydroxy-3-cyclohexene-1-carboxylate synthase